MNRVLIFGLLASLMVLTACAPKEDPAIKEAAEQAALAKAKREETFGAAANDPAIAWRTSGLGIKIITPGEGASPKMTDRVRVHYVGKLKDGTVFDESRSKKPMDFTVAHLMGGWAAAMSSLKRGGTAVFFIPPELGYGSQKAGNIPPNSGLIFEVELLELNPAPVAKK